MKWNQLALNKFLGGNNVFACVCVHFSSYSMSAKYIFKNCYNSVSFADDELKMWVLVAESLPQPTLCMQTDHVRFLFETLTCEAAGWSNKPFSCTVISSEFEPSKDDHKHMCVDQVLTYDKYCSSAALTTSQFFFHFPFVL